MYFICIVHRDSSFNPDTDTILEHMDKAATIDPVLKALKTKMQRDNAPEAAIEVFNDYYCQLKSGKSATIPESSITPVQRREIIDRNTLDRFSDQGKEALKQTVILKLNGGLGTTLGLAGPKSLIDVKNNLSFLDIAFSQVDRLNKSHGSAIPILLMSSFFTEQATLQKLDYLATSGSPNIHHFSQHRFPRILVSTREAVSWPSDPLLEWSPAGHGDLLLSLATSGELRRLIDKGYRYLFVSNIDNLGATVDLSILGYFVAESLDFLMEVTDRTPMDRKGGHLARSRENNRIILRELSQCSRDDQRSFSDINRHPFFNTNNIWLDLAAIDRAVAENRHRALSLIVNKKRVDPLDDSTPEVFQLESALGSALSMFEKSTAVCVPRSRFAPVKNAEELLLLWSDYYELTEEFAIIVNPLRKITDRVRISLDDRYYANVDQLRERFPFGPPSLIECESLSICGDVRFGSGVRVKGQADITSQSLKQVIIPDGTEISGNMAF
jgi:UTP--glucose-1-phosphate uridylyltransferase